MGLLKLSIEVLQVREDGIRRQIGIGGVVRQVEFTIANQLVPIVTSFHLKRVPFRSEGVYEFRVIAADEDGSWIALNGETAQIRLLEHWGAS